MKRGLCQLAALHFGFTLLLTPGPLAAADLVHAKDGSGVYGYNDTPVLPWCGFRVHDADRPAPKRIDPGPAPAPGVPPSDALALFNGKDLAQWQPADWKVFTPPLFAGDKLAQPARITMFHNGALVHLNQQIYGETGHRILPEYQQHVSQGPLRLSGHNSPVRFRNIWLRKL